MRWFIRSVIALGVALFVLVMVPPTVAVAACPAVCSAQERCEDDQDGEKCIEVYQGGWECYTYPIGDGCDVTEETLAVSALSLCEARIQANAARVAGLVPSQAVAEVYLHAQAEQRRILTDLGFQTVGD